MSPKRPSQVPQRVLTQAQRNSIAHCAKYVGSGEHKIKKWWGGQPKARVDKQGNVKARDRKQKTSICHLVSAEQRDLATSWVREAIRRGQYNFVLGDKDYPKHIWFTADGQDWFGFCVNSVAGEYKGWPLEDGELNEILANLVR